MPPNTDSSTADRYDRFDGENVESSRPRTSGFSRWTGFLVTTVALALIAGYERLLRPEAFLEWWEPTPTDWLFYVSLLVFVWFVVVPAWTKREQTAVFWRRIRNDPIALGCFTYLVVIFVAGTIGTAILPHVRPPIGESYQPSIFAPASVDVTGDCAGRTYGGYCFGTLTYPFGTDQIGRSIFHRTIEGSRVALQITFIVSMISVPIAIAVGTVSGYTGGWIDTVSMRYVDVQQTVPAFLIYLILSYVFGRSLFLFVLVFGLLSWGAVARIVRSEVLQLRERQYVDAARSYGVGRVAIIRRHLIPNLSGTVLTAFSQAIAWIILVEAALAFLGLTTGPFESWGHVITSGFQLESNFVDHWWVMTLPGVVLMLTVVSFAVIGDRLRDVSDPRLRGTLP